MTKLIATLSMIFLSVAHAQDNDTHRIQQTYQTKLAQLETMGNDEIGYYPLCSEIVKVYLQEKQAILEQAQQEYLLPEEHTMIQVEVGINKAEDQRHIDLGQESDVHLVSDRKGGYSSHNNCFTGNTPVTVFYSETFKLGLNHYEREKVFRSIELQEMYEHREDTQFHVLSSSLGKIEKAPTRYHKDCWARVNQVYLGHVDHGKNMITLGIGNKDAQQHFEVTPQHRFYAYLEGECSESSLYVWQEAQNLQHTDIRLYQGEEGQLCPINYTSKYTVEGGGIGNLMPKKVYNLNTDTHVYYVGPKANQVLVHDTKWINE